MVNNKQCTYVCYVLLVNRVTPATFTIKQIVSKI